MPADARYPPAGHGVVVSMRWKRWWARWLALAVVLVLASPALAKDPDKRARAGRITALSGWTGMGVGATASGLSLALGVYDPPQDWTRKPAYDHGFLVREDARVPLLVTGAGIGGTGFVVMTTGTMIEAYGLRRVKRHTVVPGWIGLALMTSGIPMSPFLPYAGIPIATAGGILVVSQFAVNVAAERRLDPATHERLYGPMQPKVHLMGVPTFRADGGGAALVGIF